MILTSKNISAAYNESLSLN